MSIIVGVVDDDGTIYMGSDTGVFDTNTGMSSGNAEKVFLACSGSVIMGICGTLRDLQVVKLGLANMVGPDSTVDIHEWLGSDLYPAILTALEGAVGGVDDERIQSSIIIGVHGHLYDMDGIGGISLHNDEYAIGSGNQLALGALAAMECDNPEERVWRALKATSQWCIYVNDVYDIKKLPV